MILETPVEFRFSECLKYLGRSDLEPLHKVTEGKVAKLLLYDGHLVLMECSSPKGNGLDIKFLNGAPSTEAKLFVTNYVRHWFDLDRDLSPFYVLAEKDDFLKDLVKKYYGLRMLRISNLFQALCWAIIGQQVNLKFAYTLYRRFIESFGEKLDFEGKSFWLFPAPEVISCLRVADLRSLQFTGKKSEYIIGLARLMKDGELSKEQLAALGDFELVLAALTKIRGVGLWTANYVLMRCFGFANAFPIQDVGLHRAIQLQLGSDRKPTIEEIRQLAAGWKDWEAYVTFYLYRSLL